MPSSDCPVPLADDAHTAQLCVITRLSQIDRFLSSQIHMLNRPWINSADNGNFLQMNYNSNSSGIRHCGWVREEVENYIIYQNILYYFRMH